MTGQNGRSADERVLPTTRGTESNVFPGASSPRTAKRPWGKKRIWVVQPKLDRTKHKSLPPSLAVVGITLSVAYVCWGGGVGNSSGPKSAELSEHSRHKIAPALHQDFLSH